MRVYSLQTKLYAWISCLFSFPVPKYFANIIGSAWCPTTTNSTLWRCEVIKQIIYHFAVIPFICLRPSTMFEAGSMASQKAFEELYLLLHSMYLTALQQADSWESMHLSRLKSDFILRDLIVCVWIPFMTFIKLVFSGTQISWLNS